ncbi:hypothetical protein [Prevotella sp. tc2-28]|nr:hypothetical protein [Prevotella sp. tc2-28]
MQAGDYHGGSVSYFFFMMMTITASSPNMGVGIVSDSVFSSFL